METLKRSLEVSYDFSSAGAFRTIDITNRGSLNSVTLDDFFKRNSHFMSDYELMAIIRRIDTEGDAQITYLEFCDFMKTDPGYPLYKTTPLELYSPYYRSLLPYSYQHDLPYYYSTIPRYRYYYSPPRVTTPTKTKVDDDKVDLNEKYTSPYRSTYRSPYRYRSIYRSAYRSSPSLASSLARSRSYYSPFTSRYASGLIY